MTVILKPSNILADMADLDRRLRILENTGRVTPAVTRAGWPVNVYKTSVYMNALQTIADNSEALLTFDTITYDTSGGFNATTHKWTAPTAGYYQMCAFATIVSAFFASRVQQFSTLLYVNNSIVKQGTNAMVTQAAVAASYSLTSLLAAELALNSGDVVEIHGVTTNQGSSASLSGGVQQNCWDMHLLST